MHFGTVQIVELIIMAACAAAVWLSARKNCTPRVRWGAVLLTLCALFPAEKLQESLSLTKDRSLIFAFFAFMGVVTILVTTLLEQRAKWEKYAKRWLELWDELKGWKLFAFYALHYTLLFVLLSSFVFASFAETGKTFAYIHDGVAQHLSGMIYTSKTIRESFQSLLSGQGWSYPLYDFQKGINNNGLPTNYFYIFTALFSEKNMDLFYQIYVYFVYYLIGLSFSYFGFFFQQRPIPVLIGAVSYAFCGHALNVAVRHMIFGMIMAIFPLIIIGGEMVLRKKSGWLLLTCVFLSVKAGSLGLYFSCMEAVFLFIYVTVRFFDLYETERLREYFALLGRLFIWGVPGILMGGFSLVPALLSLRSTGRIGVDVSEFTDMLRYNNFYYEKFLTEFIVYPEEYSNYMTLGMSVLSLPAVLLLFLRKEKKERALRYLFLILTVMLLAPWVAYIMSGFSHLSNRFVFGYSFCISAILMFMVPKFAETDKKTMRQLAVLLIAYIGLCYFGVSLTSRKTEPLIMLCLVFVLGVFYEFGEKCSETKMALGLLVITCVSVSYSGYLKYSPEQLKYVNTFDEEPLKRFEQGQYYALGSNRNVRDDTDFFRVAGDSMTIYDLNASFLYNLNGLTAYVSSGLNANYLRWLQEMEMPYYSTSLRYYGLDTRGTELTLAGVKYYAKKQRQKQTVPYGFEKIADSTDGNEIYVNRNALPLAYTYERYMSREDYDKLNAINKQDAQLQAIVLENKPQLSRLEKLETPHALSKKLQIDAVDKDNISWSNGELVVNNGGGTITLEYDAIPFTETLVRVVDLDLTEDANTRQWMLTVEKDDDKAYGFFTADAYMYANHQHTQMMSLGYAENESNEKERITLSFPAAGTFHLGDVQIWAESRDGYAERIEALRAEPLENVELNYRGLTGDITVSTDKLLCFSIPYDSGWTAYVDGQKVKLYQANTAWMAVELSAGYHTVELKYWTPGLTVGIVMSVIGAAMLVVLIVLRKRSLVVDARFAKEETQLKKTRRAEQRAQRKRAWDEAWESLSATNDPTEADEGGLREENRVDTEAALPPESETADSEAPELAAASAGVQPRETPQRKQKKRR